MTSTQPTPGTPGTPGTAGTAGTSDRDHGPGHDRSMVRSEEHLRPGTVVVESRRLRVRKVVTTEMETVTVPVRRERVVVEELPVEPVDGSPVATNGAPWSDEPVVLLELVLHEERPVVSTVVVPVERVRVVRQTDTDVETVSGVVRQEQVEVVVDR